MKVIIWKLYEFAIEWTPTWQDAAVVDHAYFWYGWFYGWMIRRAYGPALSQYSGGAFWVGLGIILLPFLACHFLKLYDAMPIEHQYLRAFSMVISVAALRVFDSFGPRFKWSAFAMLSASGITLLCHEIHFNSFLAFSFIFIISLSTYAARI